MHQKIAIKISGTGSYVPENIRTNEDLAKTVETNAQWIYDKLGIRQRRISADNELTSDLAFEAAKNAIESAGINKESIDLIIVATTTPDRKAPSTACLVKNKLDIRNHCPAFDVAAVCSGFVYAMTIAANLIHSGAHKRALVIGADTFSKITDWNRRDCVFFGDGAGAIILESTQDQDAFFYSKLFAETSNTDHFTVYPEDEFFTMNPNAVYQTGSSVLPEAIRYVTNASGYGIDDISMVIPHQPSITLLRQAADNLGLPFAKFKTNMHEYANTSAATIPLLLDETVRNNEINKNDLVVFAAVGSGWTWAAAILRWV